MPGKLCAFVLVLLAWTTSVARTLDEGDYHLHDICNSTLRILWLQTGDSGNIYLHANESAAILSHPGYGQSCHVQLLACVTCKLQVTLKELVLPPCNDIQAPQFPVCISDCDHILMYESSYSDISSHFYYTSNSSSAEFEARSVVSLSSSMYIKLCLEGAFNTSNNISLEISYQVIDKVEEIEGASEGPHPRGWVSSPAFPHGYALLGEKYRYTIRNLDPGGFVHIAFDDWDLTPNTKISIYACTNVSTCTPSVHYGYYFRPVVTSPGSVLHLEFEPEYGTVESRSNTLGFRAAYVFLQENESIIPPVTACGKYFGFRPGGGGHMSFSMSQRLYDGRLHDCVWVVRKHSAFDYVMLRLGNISFAYPDWQVEIRSSITSQSTLLQKLVPADLGNTSFLNTSAPEVVTSDAVYTSYHGFYIRLRGVLSTRDNFSFTFVSYNTPDDKNCGHDGGHYCPDSSQSSGGICIDRHLVCDGHPHCMNASDEGPMCSYHHDATKPTGRTVVVACSPREFRCGGPFSLEAGPNEHPRCVPSHMVCDGWIDCSDGSDESQCATTPASSAAREGGCLTQAVACGRECVPRTLVCQLHSCKARWADWKCPEFKPKNSGVDLGIVFPLCFAAFVIIISVFAIIIRVRSRNKLPRHQMLSPPPRPSRLPSRSRRARSGIYCGTTCLHALSRSTSAGSSEPFLTNPPSYEDSLISTPVGDNVAESCMNSQSNSQNTSPLLEPPPPYISDKQQASDSEVEIDTVLT